MSAQELIRKIAREKRRRLDGGGKDFRGSLKRLVSIWSDPSHAIVELLQNADDAKAKRAIYKLLPEGILLQHNGSPFKEKEVWGICSIDGSTKEADTHTGFMGIGFKAVFKLSNAPLVFSEPYRFGFSPTGFDLDDWGWILVPHWVDPLPHQLTNGSKEETIFWLPYKDDLSAPVRTHIVNSLVQRFDSLCLLFLRNVKEIGIIHGNLKRSITCIDDVVIEERNGEKQTHRYKLISRLFRVPDELREEYRVQESGRDKAKVREVALAFGLDNEGNPHPLQGTRLYAFLPTDYRPNLHFVVQGDFILDTQRLRVDEGLLWNRWLWEGVGEVLKTAIQQFQKDKRWRYCFYRILPTKQDFPASRTEHELVRTAMIEPFWNYCRESPIVITASNDWAKAEETVLATQDVQNILDVSKLAQISGKKQYVHPTVVDGHPFLKDIGVVEFQHQWLIQALQDFGWVSGHKVQWFQKLYRLLWDKLYEKRAWSSWSQYEEIIKKLRIIITDTGGVESASRVLFPPEKKDPLNLASGIPGLAFIDSRALPKPGRELLEKLGVKSFSPENIISNTILKGFESEEWKTWNPEELNCCLEFVKAWLKGRNWIPSPELRQRLGAIRLLNEIGVIERADLSYLPNPILKRLYSESPFVLVKDDADELTFLKALGVTDIPRVLASQGPRSNREAPSYLREWSTYRWWFYRRAQGELHEIKEVYAVAPEFFHKPNLELAKAMLSFLVHYWNIYYKNYLGCSYRWRYSRSDSYWRNQSSSNISYFAWQLKEKAWLPTTQGLQPPSSAIFIPTRYIEKIAGDMVCYLKIPLDWNKNDFIKGGIEFFHYLGLKTEVDREALIYLLKKASSRAANDELKQRIARIYGKLGEDLEDEEDCDLSEIDLLTTRDEFKQAKLLFWNDDPALGQEMEFSERVSFAWLPQKDVERRFVERVFDAGKVRRLSKHLSRHIVEPNGSEQNIPLTQKLKNRAQYLYSALRHHGANSADLAKEKLVSLTVWSVPNLQVLLRLDGIEERIADTAGFYDCDENKLFLNEEAASFDIAVELVRAFGLNFDRTAEIEVILQAKSNKEIARRFAQQGISILALEEEIEEPLSEDEKVTTQAVETEQHAGAEAAEQDKGEKKEPVRQESSAPTDPNRTKSGSSSTGGSRELPNSEKTNESKSGSSTHTKTTKPHSKSVGRPSLSYEERMNREAVNIQRIMAFEKSCGRSPKDVSRNYVGYDIESIENNNGGTRYIEVKSISHVVLTRNEYRCAQENAASYYLYIVDGNVLNVIRDPANSCDVEEIEVVDTHCKVLEWQAQAKEFQLP